MQNAVVNGTVIASSAIAAEVQNHPSSTPEAAWQCAARALVIRELLIQRARNIDLRAKPEQLGDGRHETEEEALIRELLEVEITVPQTDDEVCRRYYRNNQRRFASPTLYEANHILLAARPDDEAACRDAEARAGKLIARLADKPNSFEHLAREYSDCPSRTNGGNLGQVAKGDTVPEVETFLDALDEGQLCPVPVKSRYGVHVLRLNRRIEGRILPYEAARPKIESYLSEAAWRRAVSQYVTYLGSRAVIEGIDITDATTPLVQ